MIPDDCQLTKWEQRELLVWVVGRVLHLPTMWSKDLRSTDVYSLTVGVHFPQESQTAPVA